MRLSYRQHLLEYFIYGIRQRIIFDKKTYIPIGDSYKEEFMKYISQKSIFLEDEARNRACVSLSPINFIGVNGGFVETKNYIRDIVRVVCHQIWRVGLLSYREYLC